MTDFATRRRIMVDTQVRPQDVTRFPIIEAFLDVPRERFLPASLAEAAYVGENLELPDGGVVLEPRTLAKMLEGVAPRPFELALDIAPAGGYSTAVLARMTEAVVAVEEPARAAETEATLLSEGVDNAAVHAGPLVEGAPKFGPYDVILVQGAVEVFPAALEEQLKDGGRAAAVFLDGRLGTVRIGLKADGRVNWRDAFNAGAPLLPGFERPSAFVL
ncbi:protein-L-isoaspartate(D-aspartate) O-methyltransferase [Hasllibacter halocynthiae]|uniref:Protein-L-isoaspartate O-methyltransferase n=1 Tax=Hasllibacter halocynthiae TaxID=595589 RepID=A0A2T0X692_9RHOB|nr:protein-L-isoaspartate O-methyltransferase [Hasllibacter halocynthiae]PRY94443.1 protein-L-isoaspartate(D-aspartate) O-methyltransferase [Hasllibacter halocynthiae]